MSNNYCGASFSCSNILSRTRLLPYYTTVKTFTRTLVQGYNKIELTEQVELKKGDMVLVNTALIALDSTLGLMYSDFKLFGAILTSINIISKTRLLLNCLIDRKFYFNNLPVTTTYTANGIFQNTIKYKTDTFVSFFQSITISSSKFNKVLIHLSVKLFKKVLYS